MTPIKITRSQHNVKKYYQNNRLKNGLYFRYTFHGIVIIALEMTPNYAYVSDGRNDDGSKRETKANRCLAAGGTRRSATA